ncbi:SEC23-interacting protein isoform X3 [Hylaeus anthracinus]|uniref:SEC23-interacting protein isoform X3 n=1 Tax=Hylaeus anthracinus TaxID=313031 RepID=UPI0023B8B36D|nr:SEC23-interacting protein isoform X3 [Hylaeus anthracinus]
MSDAEVDNFVGKESANSQNSPKLVTPTSTDTEFTPIPLRSENAKSTENQPAKQGYFTSILSSLPNLSLSSIKGDSSGTQTNQGFEHVAGVQNTNPYVPSYDSRDTLKHTPSPVIPNFHDPRRTNFAGSGEVLAGNTANLSTPPQPTLPPTIPSSTDGPISYRLGNQRRLKYAPPPDLTTSTSKQYSASPVPSLFTPPSVVTSTIFNPNVPVVSAPSHQLIDNPISTNPSSLQHSTPEQLSQDNSLQVSVRSSPIATGVPCSSTGTPRSVTPQSQTSGFESVPLSGKSGLFVSTSRPIPSKVLEPATPQNTPANVSFSGFDLYANYPDHLTTLNSGKGAAATGNRVATSSNQAVSHILQENIVAPSVEVKANSTFAPISAVQVTEKLEHLLAEQKEDSTNLPAGITTKPDESTTEAQVVETPKDTKSNDTEGKSELVKSDSVTDTITRQVSEPLHPPIVRQGPYTANESIDTSQSHGVSSYIPSFQQYFQAQPSASGTDFFAEKPPTQQKPSLSYTTAEVSVPTTFSDPLKAFAQPASSFFDLSGINSPLSPPQHKENIANAHADLATAPSIKNSQQSPSGTSLLSNLSSAFVPVSQASWDINKTPQAETANATCSATIQAVPPMLYNPAQFQNDFYKPSSVRHPYISPFAQPAASQAQQYFENLPGSVQVHDTAGGNSNIFLPTSPATTIVPEPTGSATLSPVQMSINPLSGRPSLDTVPRSFQNLATGTTDKRMPYRAVYHHWFYRKEVENKVLWLPFSMQDSLQLEEVHNSSEITPETTVATDGGRYDVDILRRQRSPVYWSGTPTEVRRCSWFFKGPTESKYIPYDESTAAKLEEEYKQACVANSWNRRIDLNNGEYIIFHSATVQIHYLIPSSPELTASWGNTAGSEDSAYLQGAGSRPRVLKRGVDEFHIEDGEPEKVDHLMFLVHGIGSVCDLKFRTVEEVVDEFRSISLQLVQSHYRTASEQRIVNRIEVLPISWHTTLHSEDTGIDKKLKAITLESIPKLRHFTNDTLLDILFYTSPVYCQTIMQTVGSEVNRLYALFKERNPSFDGGIYLGGHSLGSLILFDLLCHQKPLPDDNTDVNNAEASEEQTEADTDPSKTLPGRVLKRRLSKKISYVIGAAGTGQPFIHYPQLNFYPRAFFAFGSPIGMFVTVRGIDMLGEDFLLPTCPAFFNIFHPFDPVAYRIETLINPEACKYRPMLIPHHKGRKRMHLELKETMSRVGADLKQKLLDSVRNTWNSVYQLALFHKPDNSALEREIDKVVEEQMQQTPTVPDQQSNDDGGADFKVGKLNGGRRIDYVLQEAPFEYINEYIFALTSHVCYWESEDTMLMMLKEIYGSAGIQTDAQLPQQTLSIERATPSPSLMSFASTSTKGDATSSVPVIGMDPTASISENVVVGPPPKSGFVKKS